jgi:hypothetical protein
MKTKLAGKSNAVLTDYDDGTVIAIISCDKSEDITKKLEKAIAEHYVATKVKLTIKGKVLDNQNPLYFDSLHLEDGLDSCRDFKIEIIPTY